MGEQLHISNSAVEHQHGKIEGKGNTFSLIPKINILNKLFPEIKFLVIIARILLRIMFTQIIL